jgi:hypothetical protein
MVEKPVGIVVDGTGPDQNKLQTSRPDKYCDNKVYIFCV